MGKNNRNFAVLAVVIALLIVGVVMTNNRNAGMDIVEAEAAASTFINDILTNGAGGVTVEEIAEYDSKIYALKVKLDGNDELIDSYISADGKLFFPQSLDIAEMSGTDEGEEGDVAPVAQAPKSDRPVVELFVMSHCPYGTQMEKGFMPVAQALSADIDYEIKFVDYAMHNKLELDEQMKQYCIQKEQNDKFVNYLNCFLEDGDTARCLGAIGVDQGKMNVCVSAIDKQYRITEVFDTKEGWDQFPPFPIHAAENEQYGVQGSPTLVINGEQVSVGRDSASIAAVICGAFNTAPGACSQEFSSASPAPGFGVGTTDGATDATCN